MWHKNTTPKIRIKNVKSDISLTLFALPTMVYIFIFSYIPLVGLIIAFKDYNAIQGIFGSPWTSKFGFNHFFNFITLPNFKMILKNTLSISVVSLVVNMIFPIILALFVNEIKSTAFKNTVKTISYAPYFISTVVVVGMLFAFCDVDSGILSKIVSNIKGESVDLMSSASAFLPIYIISGLWQGLGWSSIIYIGTLANVDPCLHEAAVIDGASRMKRIWHINLPSIVPMAIVLLIMSVGSILSVGFDKAYLMRTAGNLEVSQIISTYSYEVSLFSKIPQYSYATAIGLFNSIINIILLFGANFLARKFSESSLW